MSHKIRNETLFLIESCEANKLKAYQDSIGVWTIGIGMTYYPTSCTLKNREVLTNDRIKKGDELQSKDQSLSLFSCNLSNKFIPSLDKALTCKLNDFQYGAILSLCYNIGTEAITHSTLIKRLNANEKPDLVIKQEFPKWVNSGGKRLQGLVNRRNKEIRFSELNPIKIYSKDQIFKL